MHVDISQNHDVLCSVDTGKFECVLLAAGEGSFGADVGINKFSGNQHCIVLQLVRMPNHSDRQTLEVLLTMTDNQKCCRS